MPSILPLHGPQAAQDAQVGRRTCQGASEGAAALYGAHRAGLVESLCAAPPDASHARGGSALVALVSGTVLVWRGDARSSRPLRHLHPPEPETAMLDPLSVSLAPRAAAGQRAATRAPLGSCP